MAPSTIQSCTTRTETPKTVATRNCKFHKILSKGSSCQAYTGLSSIECCCVDECRQILALQKKCPHTHEHTPQLPISNPRESGETPNTDDATQVVDHSITYCSSFRQDATENLNNLCVETIRTCGVPAPMHWRLTGRHLWLTVPCYCYYRNCKPNIHFKCLQDQKNVTRTSTVKVSLQRCMFWICASAVACP